MKLFKAPEDGSYWVLALAVKTSPGWPSSEIEPRMVYD